MRVLALIPARGGSKGIPRKNVRPLAGKPLVAHTIEHALQARLVNRVIVSTDDDEIADVSKQYGAEVIWRPAELSGDDASSESALVHAVDFLEETEGYRPDLVAFLQSTAPVRRNQDIDRAIQTLRDEGADSLLSVVPFHLFIWRSVARQARAVDYDYRRRPRRQDRAQEYMENGSIYVFKPGVLRQFNNRLGGKITLYEMDSWSSVDINTMRDLELCEWIVSRWAGMDSLASE